jgi:hypothetical protein
MAARGRKYGRALREWEQERSRLSPRYVLTNAALAYTRTECEELELLPEEYKWDRIQLCPVKD